LIINELTFKEGNSGRVNISGSSVSMNSEKSGGKLKYKLHVSG